MNVRPVAVWRRSTRGRGTFGAGASAARRSQLRRIRLELEQARDQYLDLYRLAPVAYLTLDPSGLILDANVAAAALLGATRAQLAGCRLRNLAERDSAANLERHLGRVFERRTRQTCEIDLHAFDGRALTVRLESVVEPGAHQPARGRTALVDMTDDRHREAELRRLAAVVSNSPDAILVVDLLGRIVAWNRGAVALYGYSADEAIGLPMLTLVPPAQHAAMRQVAEQLAAGDSVHGFESQRITRDGRLLEVSVTAAVLADPGGKPQALTTTERDITEQKRMQSELREREARLAAMLRTVSDAIVIVDDAGAIETLCSGSEQVFGVSAAEVQGRPFTTLASGAPSPLVAGRAPIEGVRGDGSRFPATLTLGAMELPGSARWVAFVRDLTEERRLSDALVEAKKLEALGRLASGVAHDYANLFMGLDSCLALVSRHVEPGSRALRYLDRCVASVRRGAGLCKQLKSFGRPQPGERRRVALDALTTETVDLLGYLLGESFALCWQPGAPGVVVIADPGRLEQIILNLALNARDAMPLGGPVELATTTRSDPASPTGRWVELLVRDCGVGIAPDALERIFEPFFTTKVHGTGLGLAMVRRTVDELGGRVEIESAPGQGTTVRVRLPAAAELERASATTVAPTGRALVVDDDAGVLTAMARSLERLGWLVTTVQDPLDGLRRCRDGAEGFDLLVTDVTMPGVGGAELAAALRARRGDAPIVFVSGRPGPEHVAEGRLPAGARVLLKPVGFAALAEAVRHVTTAAPG